jgi:hypothetical protein
LKSGSIFFFFFITPHLTFLRSIRRFFLSSPCPEVQGKHSCRG